MSLSDNGKIEDTTDVSAITQSKVCCRCDKTIWPGQEKFDNDHCYHDTCLECRFRDDLECSLCKPKCKSYSPTDGTTEDKAHLNLMADFPISLKKSKINTDHLVDIVLSTNEGTVPKQMCTICKRVFKSSNARYHYACASGDKPHSCAECGQKFVKKSHMTAHMNSHYGIKPYQCAIRKCKAAFTQKDKLIRHMKTHNRKEKTHSCPVCDKQYSSQPVLHTHMVKVHSSLKPFQCDLCPRSYKYKKSLRIHSLKHQAIREFMCEICGKKYTLFSQLKHHKRSHIIYHRRPHKCAFCGRRFMTQRDRVRHELCHNTSRDFECSLCNTTFGRKDNLERHMKNFHQDNPPTVGTAAKLIAVIAPLSQNPTVDKDKHKIENNKVKHKVLNKPEVREPNADLTNFEGESQNLEKLEKLPLGKENCISDTSGENILNESEQSLEQDCPKSPEPQSVIVSPKLTENQNRPSVIKPLPKLLPYRVLPPEKRFLKMAAEISKGKDPSELMPPPLMKFNIEKPTLQKLPNKPQKAKVPKEDALNRCFRIIRHTNSFQEEHNNLLFTNRSQYSPINPVLNKTDSCASETKIQISLDSSSLSTLSSNPRFTTVVPFTNTNMYSDCSNLSSNHLGGPTLPTSFPEVDTVPEESFVNSYVPLGESLCSSYTPYFDTDCFRAGEGTPYEDLDMGLGQYISEQFRVTR